MPNSTVYFINFWILIVNNLYIIVEIRFIYTFCKFINCYCFINVVAEPLLYDNDRVPIMLKKMWKEKKKLVKMAMGKV